MYHINRAILPRLWITSTYSLFSCVLVYWFYGFFLSFVVGFIGTAGILYNAQDYLLYHQNFYMGSRAFILKPNNYTLLYEIIKIKNKDGLKIHLYLIKERPIGTAPTIILFHGNTGNMDDRLTNDIWFFYKLKINVLMVEYRGYGLSGAPSENGLYVDAQSALDYLLQRNDINHSKIIVFGCSVGGAVAIDLASRPENRHKIWALIVENTFTSIPDMAHVILKWKCLHWLLLFCHKNKYMSIKKMDKVLSPTLIIYGSNDTLVPPRMSKELYLRCGANSKALIAMTGVGHYNTWTSYDYYTMISHFFAWIIDSSHMQRCSFEAT